MINRHEIRSKIMKQPCVVVKECRFVWWCWETHRHALVSGSDFSELILWLLCGWRMAREQGTWLLLLSGKPSWTLWFRDIVFTSFRCNNTRWISALSKDWACVISRDIQSHILWYVGPWCSCGQCEFEPFAVLSLFPTKQIGSKKGRIGSCNYNLSIKYCFYLFI